MIIKLAGRKGIRLRSLQQRGSRRSQKQRMNTNRRKWNPPGWPWELEILTLLFCGLAVWGPYHVETFTPEVSMAAETSASGGAAVSTDPIKTQFRFMIGVGIIALYIIHLIIASSILSHITVSPMHFFSPAAFALIAHFRITHTEGFANAGFDFLSKSNSQAALIFVIVITATAILMWVRRIRYMRIYSGTEWGIASRAVYDRTYLELLMQMKPLFYPPRRYLAGPEGIVIEGWHYAMPIGMGDINSMKKMSVSGIMSAGDYFSGAMRNAVRIDLHDSRQGLFISPENPDAFIAYCEQFLVKRRSGGPGTSTRHGSSAAGQTQRIPPLGNQAPTQPPK